MNACKRALQAVAVQGSTKPRHAAAGVSAAGQTCNIHWEGSVTEKCEPASRWQGLAWALASAQVAPTSGVCTLKPSCLAQYSFVLPNSCAEAWVRDVIKVEAASHVFARTVSTTLSRLVSVWQWDSPMPPAQSQCP